MISANKKEAGWSELCLERGLDDELLRTDRRAGQGVAQHAAVEGERIA